MTTHDTPDAHDMAIKGAVTDALKRALRTFGPQFGNGLYEHDDIAPPKPPQQRPLPNTDSASARGFRIIAYGLGYKNDAAVCDLLNIPFHPGVLEGLIAEKKETWGTLSSQLVARSKEGRDERSP